MIRYIKNFRPAIVTAVAPSTIFFEGIFTLMSKGVFYERNNRKVGKTCEEIFGSSESADGDKLDGERASGSARRSAHRLRVGGVLYCVDGDETGIDRDPQSGDGKTSVADGTGAPSVDGVRGVQRCRSFVDRNILHLRRQLHDILRRRIARLDHDLVSTEAVRRREIISLNCSEGR